MTTDLRASVLLVEDTAALAGVYREYLRAEPYDVMVAATGRAAVERLRADPPALMLLDIMLPDMDGMDILHLVTRESLPTQTIVITAHGSIKVAVAAMRRGAFDFLVKPFSAERLRIAMRNALRLARLDSQVAEIKSEFGRDGFLDFVGDSLAMQAVYRILQGAAASSASVLISGESGVGKDLAARTLHKLSPRRAAPFVVVNCAEGPPARLDALLFGAATGAAAEREAAIARAEGGALFLDHATELDGALQAKLLRFLHTGLYAPADAERERVGDCRIVAAVLGDPYAAVREGRFREDLYYKLNVISLALPPLRHRDGDAVLMARRILARWTRHENRRFESFAPEAELWLADQPWPGNVRELENVVRRAVVLNDGPVMTREMLAGDDEGAPPVPAPPGRRREAPARAVLPLWRIEKNAIEEAIAACEGSVPRAAAMLEVSASTIYRKRQIWSAG